jgi:hypothetical protein
MEENMRKSELSRVEVVFDIYDKPRKGSKIHGHNRRFRKG